MLSGSGLPGVGVAMGMRVAETLLGDEEVMRPSTDVEAWTPACASVLEQESR